MLSQVEGLTGIPVEGQKLLGPLSKLSAAAVVDAAAVRGKPVTVIGTTRSRAAAATRASMTPPASPEGPDVGGDKAAPCADSTHALAASAAVPATGHSPGEAAWLSRAAAAATAPMPATALHCLSVPKSDWTVVVDVEGVLVR